MSLTHPALVIVDIGGTNLRIATFDDNHIFDFATACCEDGNPEVFISGYLAEHHLEGAAMCIAIACPVDDDHISMTNFDWQFSKSALQQRLGLSQLFIINDFHAMSLCVPNIASHELIQVGGGKADSTRACVVCGPGTGMGLGQLIPINEQWLALPCEGGHADFAPNSELEMAIWQILHKEYSHVFVERLLSGPGLVRLYQALCELEGLTPEPFSAADISSHALATSNDLCTRALTSFCEMLGSYCGSLALNAGALGGVYITGGMVPKFLDFFMASPFRERFEAKGTYSEYVKEIPSFVITSSIPGLIGATEYLRGQLISQGYPLNREPIRETT